MTTNPQVAGRHGYSGQLLSRSVLTVQPVSAVGLQYQKRIQRWRSLWWLVVPQATYGTLCVCASQKMPVSPYECWVVNTGTSPCPMVFTSELSLSLSGPCLVTYEPSIPRPKSRNHLNGCDRQRVTSVTPSSCLNLKFRLVGTTDCGSYHRFTPYIIQKVTGLCCSNVQSPTCHDITFSNLPV